ncbi:KHG/KDPG aldolase/sugar kinase fusion protein [candidate division KSB1 bacterium]
MNRSEAVFKILKENRSIALLSPKSVDECIKAYEILNPMGAVLEIAFRSEFAESGIKALLKKYPDALILAGTVMTAKQALSAVEAGVSGVVSADYIPSVVEVCVRKDIMCIPGGLSDAGKQLVQKADLYGCSLEELKIRYPYQWIYKLFPAVAGKVSNMDTAKALRGPYKDLTFIYTGGVSLENLEELFVKDTTGIFCGSAMTKSIGDTEKMKQDAENWLDILKGKPKKPAEARAVSAGAGAAPKIITFGEIMLRLSPPDNLRFIQTKTYDATYGGAEANTAAAFANYGLDSVFITALPDNEIGQGAVNLLRSFGVNTDLILRSGNRTGIYFLEYGASQRSSKVVYDRAHSSISEIKAGQVDWDSVFEGAVWFHWSGITPALSDSAAEATLEALKSAKKYGVTVSVDLNYRKKLWSKEKAGRIMTGLMEYVDLCIGNEEDADSFFGIRAGDTDLDSGKLNEESYKDVAKQLVERFNLKKAAITLRKSISASDNEWSACLYNGKDFLLSSKYPIHIVDRVGGGDSFSSGLIYALIAGKTDTEALEFGVAASCLKQTIHGDFNLVTVKEIEHLASGKTGGRVQR